MKQRILLIGFLALFAVINPLYSQQAVLGHAKHEKCGFDERHEFLMKNDPAYALVRAQEEKHYQEYLKNPSRDKVTYTIPVVVHIIHTGQAEGVGANISAAQVQSAIDNLNAAYSNTSTALTTYTGVNTNIQFCLAQRDASGNPTTGILRVDGSGVTGYSTKGVCDAGGGTGTDNEVAVKALSKWDNTKYYNIWVVTEINDNNAGAGTQGYAYFPGAGPTKDGTIIMYNSFGYDPDGSLGYNLKSYTNRNITTVHELGHGLNLYHTFEGDGSGATCPTGNGCGSGVGDCVSDTPPHRRSNSDCLSGGTNSCDGNSSKSLYVHNFMDYSSDACQTEYTAGQATRMVATMTGIRSSLAASDGCNPVFTNDVSIFLITSPNGAVCGDDQTPVVVLKNSGSATLISATITYDIDGGTPQVFNWTGSLASNATEVVNLPLISGTAGSHTFNVAASSPNGGADEYAPNNSKTANYTAAGAGPTATCTPTLTNSGNFGTGIDRFRLNTIDNAHTADDNDGVQDFTCEHYTTVTANTAYNFTVNLDGGSPESCNIYIDYNDNGTFEAGEMVFSSGSTSATHTGTITIPVFPEITGKIIRLRVVSDFGGISGPCATLDYGEIEDYGLYITPPPCTAPTISSHPTNQGGCVGQNTSFNTVISGPSLSYQWQVDNGGGFTNITNGGIYSGTTTSTLSLTAFSIAENDYNYRCIVTNPCGNVTTNSASLSASLTPAVACNVNTTNIGNFGTGIIRVRFNTLDNANDDGVNDHTKDFACNSTTVVDANTSYNFTINLKGTSLEHCRIYIDYNNDGIFNDDATERVYNSVSKMATHTGSILIPASPTVTGQLIRMRVISDFNGIVSACTALEYGEIEDYGINITPPPCVNPTVNTNPSDAVICENTNTSFTVSASNVTGYQWQEDNGGGFANITNGGIYSGATSATLTLTGVSAALNSNVYRCVVSNACSNVNTNAANLTVNSTATPTISAGSATTFCTGGSVVLTSSSATGNVWSPGGQTTQSITVSASGTYSVTASASGCSATSTNTVVTVNTPPTIAEGTLTSPSSCGGSDGSIIITGTGTGNISWTGTSSGTLSGVTLPATVTGLSAGSYDFTFDNGCTSNTVSSTLSDPSAPATPTISSSDGDNVLCPSQTLTLTSSAASGNVWSPSGATTQSITVSAAGTFSVTTTVAGCSSTSTNTVVTTTAAPSIAAGTISNPSICGASDGSIQINGTGTGTLSWTGTATGSVAVTLPNTVTALAAGSYDFTFNDGCPSAVVTQALSDPSAPATPTITASGATTFCSGGSVTLTSSAATGNTWSTGATSASISVSTGGSYTVMVTSGSCSSTSAATTVTVQTGATIATGTTTNPSACGASDGSIQVTGTGSGNLSWTGAATGSLTGVTLPVTVTGLAAGSYTFDLAGTCPSNSLNASISDPSAPAAPTISSSDADNIVCQGETVTLTSSAATGNTWSNGATTQSIVVSATGTFNTTINVAGCSSTSANTTVTVNAIPTISFGTITAPSTCGTATGIIQVIGSGTGTLSWTGTASGTTTGTLPLSAAALAAGSYTFTFDDGCTSTGITQTLTDPSAPATPTITAGSATTFCSGNNVTLTSSYATGNVWSSGETTVSITVSASGTYTVAQTQAGCTSTSAGTTVTVNALPSITLGTTNNPSACATTDGDIQILGTGTGNLSWTGTTTGSLTGITLPSTVTGLGAGSYDFTFDDGCASNVLTGVLSDPGAPATPTISSSDADNIICQGETVTLTSSAVTGNTWSPGGETTQAITVSANATVNVTVNVSGCTATSTNTSVTVNAVPAIASGTLVHPTSCGSSDGSIQITGTGTGTLSWTGIASGSVSATLPYTESSLIAGSYSFTFDDGCTSNTITETLVDPGSPAAPIITTSGPTAFCDGGSVVLTSSSATDNVWSTGETTQAITVTTDGTYTVVLNVGGCSSAAATQTVTVTPVPTTSVTISSDAAANTICAGTNVNFSAVALGGGASPTYQWKLNGTNVGSGLSTYSNNSLINLDGVTCEVSNTDLCGTTVTSNTITMAVNPISPAAVSIVSDDADNSICAGTTVTFTATPTNGGSTPSFIWKRNNIAVLSGTTFTSSALVNGDLITCDITSSDVCAVPNKATSNTITMIVQTSTPTISTGTITKPSTCGNTDGSIQITGSGTGTLSWTGTATGSQAVTLPATVGSLGAGAYTFTFNNGCGSGTTNSIISDPGIPTVPTITAGGPTSFCAGSSVTLTSSVTTGITWSTGETSASIEAMTSGSYTVTVTSGTCSVTSSAITVTAKSLPPVPTITSSNGLGICAGTSTTLSSSAANGNLWNPGNQVTQDITVSTAGSYSVTVTLSGCSSSSAVTTITVNPNPVVSITAIPDMCDTAAVVTLSTGLPAGGTYTVNGATSSVFDPSTAIIGSNDIVYTVTDLNNCSGSASTTVTVDQCLGLSEQVKQVFSVYPNPSSSLITISGNASSEIQSAELRDQLGRLVATYDLKSSEKVIDVSQHADGIYQLWIKAPAFTEVQTIRILK